MRKRIKYLALIVMAAISGFLIWSGNQDRLTNDDFRSAQLRLYGGRLGSFWRLDFYSSHGKIVARWIPAENVDHIDQHLDNPDLPKLNVHQR